MHNSTLVVFLLSLIVIFSGISVFGVDEAYAATDTWTTATITNVGLTPIESVSMTSPSNGVAVGGVGNIIYTEDGGVTWNTANIGLSKSLMYFYGVSMFDTKIGVAVGNGGGIVVYTEDGGKNWSVANRPFLGGIIMYGVSMGSATNSVAVGAGGHILYTTDGGKNWAHGISNTDKTLRDVSMTNATHGVAVGRDGTVMYTSDSGKTWSKATTNVSDSINLRSVSMGSATHGIAVGTGGTIIYTSDGGKNWSKTTTNMSDSIIFRGVSMASATYGVAVGMDGIIINTNDGGKTWNTLRINNAGNTHLYDVSMFSAIDGVVVGANGTVMYITSYTSTTSTTTSTTSSTISNANKGGISSGDCDDCEAPTMGINSESKRIVENGFTYNGKSVDAERYYTPYPLITVNIGEQNTAIFRIYEDKGPENIKHFTLAFGLDANQPIANSKVMIELDIDNEGTQTVTVTDPQNALENINVYTNIGNCNVNDSDTKCLIVTINHTFRDPLAFNIVATDVWDMQRNAWQNYFNHGIEVSGESLNPMLVTTIPGPEKYEGVIQITQTSKSSDVWVSEDGREFIQNDYGTFIEINKTHNHTIDTDALKNRTHSEFYKLVNYEINRAQSTMEQICVKCGNESYDKIHNTFAYELPDVYESKYDDPRIQALLAYEEKKAQKLLDE